MGLNSDRQTQTKISFCSRLHLYSTMLHLHMKISLPLFLLHSISSFEQNKRYKMWSVNKSHLNSQSSEEFLRMTLNCGTRLNFNFQLLILFPYFTTLSMVIPLLHQGRWASPYILGSHMHKITFVFSSDRSEPTLLWSSVGLDFFRRARAQLSILRFELGPGYF